jgi:hypothetical protein
MKTNVPVKKQRVDAKTQPPDIQRRIDAGWLKLWRKAYPNTPPPVEGGRRKTEGGGAGDSSYRVCGPIQGDMKANSKVQRLKAKVQPAAPARQRGESLKSDDRGRRTEGGGKSRNADTLIF